MPHTGDTLYYRATLCKYTGHWQTHLPAALRTAAVNFDDAFGKSRVRVHPVSIKRRRNSVTRPRPPPFLRRMLQAEKRFPASRRTFRRSCIFASSRARRAPSHASNNTHTRGMYFARWKKRQEAVAFILHFANDLHKATRGTIDKFSLSLSLPLLRPTPFPALRLSFRGERVLFFRTVQFTVSPPPAPFSAWLLFFFNNKRRIFYHFFLFACFARLTSSGRRERRSIECARMAGRNFRRRAIMQYDRTFYHPENIVISVAASSTHKRLHLNVIRDVIRVILAAPPRSRVDLSRDAT